jgi:hypothetical protein
VFFTNDPPAIARILPVARGGIDQLTGSFPAEFPVSVNLDEIVYPCSDVRVWTALGLGKLRPTLLRGEISIWRLGRNSL